MTTRAEMRADLDKVYGFLRAKANSRGLITLPQHALAEELGMPSVRFHRLLHKLADVGLVKFSGGGRHAKTILVRKPGGAELEPEQAERGDRVAVALRLFDVVCEAVNLGTNDALGAE